MYSEVASWFNAYLANKFPEATIRSYDTSKENLHKFIKRHGLAGYFPEAETYVFKVGVTGVIQYKEKCLLALVECKTKPITLRDVCRFVGCVQVVLPAFSIIVSPRGVSPSINKLINVYRRYDVLTYNNSRKVRIARWNSSTKDIDTASLLPHGEHI